MFYRDGLSIFNFRINSADPLALMTHLECKIIISKDGIIKIDLDFRT